MKIEVGENYEIVLKEVYGGTELATEENNRIGICMRDDTFEISVIDPKTGYYKWFRVDYDSMSIKEM